jgi:hypothetical protein
MEVNDQLHTPVALDWERVHSIPTGQNEPEWTLYREEQNLSPLPKIELRFFTLDTHGNRQDINHRIKMAG